MFSHKVLCVYLLTQFTFTCVYTQYSYGCDENSCSKIQCPDLKCEEGKRLLRNATQCGCCHICIQILQKGEKCKALELAVIPKQECGPGLVCDIRSSTCVPADTQCLKDQLKFDQDLKSGHSSSDRSRPECDEYGFYKSPVCVTDVLCYCVDKNGNRIFGTDLASNYKKMNCHCSRQFEEFPKDVPGGDFLRCLPNGNYDSLQCTEKWCFCMGDSFRIVGTVVKANTTLEDLLCYDKERHRYDDAMLRSKCWNERYALLNQINEYGRKAIKVIGVDLPQCDLDGSYAPVQCKKDKCYCVKRNGELYESSRYKVARSSNAAKDMTCRCNREKEMLGELKNEDKIKEFFTEYPCDDSSGNYINEY